MLRLRPRRREAEDVVNARLLRSRAEEKVMLFTSSAGKSRFLTLYIVGIHLARRTWSREVLAFVPRIGHAASPAGGGEIPITWKMKK